MLHLEPDVVEMLADRGRARVVARNRVAGDLLVLKESLLGPVVERPWGCGVHHGLHLATPRSSAFAGVSVPPIGAPDGEPISVARS